MAGHVADDVAGEMSETWFQIPSTWLTLFPQWASELMVPVTDDDQHWETDLKWKSTFNVVLACKEL